MEPSLPACTPSLTYCPMQMAEEPGLAWVSAMFDITSQPLLPPPLRLPPGKQPAAACPHACTCIVQRHQVDQIRSEQCPGLECCLCSWDSLTACSLLGFHVGIEPTSCDPHHVTHMEAGGARLYDNALPTLTCGPCMENASHLCHGLAAAMIMPVPACRCARTAAGRACSAFAPACTPSGFGAVGRAAGRPHRTAQPGEALHA